jgi:DNA-directed RNA polymerase subunit RPC12/RpoP
MNNTIEQYTCECGHDFLVSDKQIKYIDDIAYVTCPECGLEIILGLKG